MASVTLTAALRANLLSLQGTATLLDQTQLRLASGKKVNSALDNPANFFAAQALTNRAGDLSNLLDGMGQAIQVLTAADQGITSLTKLVQQAQSLAQSAQNTLSSSGLARSGDFSAAQLASLTAANGFNANDKLTLTSGSGATGSVTITAGMSASSFVAAVNAISGFSAQIVQGTAGTAAGGGRIEIRATGGQTLRLDDGVAGTVARMTTAHGVAGGSTGTDGAGAALAATAVIAATSNTVDQISLELQYNTIRSQIDTLIADTGYQGTNLLNGDTLTVKFNEKNTSSLSVTGVTYTANTGLGITYTAATTFLNAANIQTSLNQVTAALATIRAQAQTFGNNLTVVQTRQDFTKNLINTLKTGSDALTLADKNEEGANLLSLQTAQQLGIQALALASQANQSVLRLFG